MKARSGMASQPPRRNLNPDTISPSTTVIAHRRPSNILKPRIFLTAGLLFTSHSTVQNCHKNVMDSSDSLDYDTYVENGGEGVTGRLFKFCVTWKDQPVSKLWTTCKICESFFAFCCGHSKTSLTAKPCHHYQLCFTDGACLNNGQSGSRAGIGGALGKSEADQWAIPIDDSVDPDGKRSSQRAELLAAIEGLRRLSEAKYDHGVTPRPHPGQEGNPDSCWVIATDSEYVCNGITQWVYHWRVRGPSSPLL